MWGSISGVRLYEMLEEPKGPKGVSRVSLLVGSSAGAAGQVQGYLAHTKTPNPLEPPLGS